MDHTFLDETKCVFYIPNLLKTSCSRFHQYPFLECKVYPAKKTVVTIVKTYLQKTERLIHTDDSLFFISYMPPHKEVTLKALACGVMDIFQKAGISPTTFTTHSVRSSGTLNSFQKGLSLTELSKVAGWSNAKTFGKFYNKSYRDDTNFATFLIEENM